MFDLPHIPLPMIRFQYPELGLLVIPAWFAYRRWGRVPGVTGWLRLVLAVLLIVGLMGPEMNLGGKGIDVIVVADRSRSMPAAAESNIRELIENLEKNRVGDRIGISRSAAARRSSACCRTTAPREYTRDSSTAT
jgi:hypothetical protein